MSSIGQFNNVSAIDAPLDERMAFLRKAYLHLAGAVGVFILLSTLIYQMGIGQKMIEAMGEGKGFVLLLFGGFVALSWLSTALTRSEASPVVQYLGLGLYVVLEAVIFAPLLFIAAKTDPTALSSAAIVSTLTFGGLTAYVMTTRKDFSFLGPILLGAILLAFGAIVCGLLFGFNLGIWFSVAMIAVAIGATLYTTSKVLLIYRTDQHIAAGTELFAALAMLFYYILRLFLQMRR